VQVINADVAKKQKSCQEDLAKAEPALIAAKSALGTLNKVGNLVHIVLLIGQIQNFLLLFH